VNKLTIMKEAINTRKAQVIFNIAVFLTTSFFTASPSF